MKKFKRIVASLLVMCAVVVVGSRVKRMAEVDPPVPPRMCISVVVIDPLTPPIM